VIVLVAAATAVTAAGATPARRDYAQGSWSATFYRPQEIQISGLGLVNDDSTILAARRSVSSLHSDGLLARIFKIERAEITAFHLCHHRSSIFYEVLSDDGGQVTVFERSLYGGRTVQVREFVDLAPATSLACVDNLLLRASPAKLLAIDTKLGSVHVLRDNVGPQLASSEGVVTSLTVGHAADIPARAEIFAANPHNRTLLRLHLTMDTGPPILHEEPLLTGGDGSDGPLAVATVRDPRQVLWSRGAVLFTDGCTLRRITFGAAGFTAAGGLVETLVGSSEDCVAPADESLQPAPWASRLSAPKALAGSAVDTAEGVVLVLTGAQVLRVVQSAHSCLAMEEEACVSQGCGWAEGPGGPMQRRCFECHAVRAWAASQGPTVDPCSLEAEWHGEEQALPAAGTRYRLEACGCVAPAAKTPASQPFGDVVFALATYTIEFLLPVSGIILALAMYRARRRAAAMREQFDGPGDDDDGVEFHIFEDDEDTPC